MTTDQPLEALTEPRADGIGCHGPMIAIPAGIAVLYALAHWAFAAF